MKTRFTESQDGKICYSTTVLNDEEFLVITIMNERGLLFNLRSVIRLIGYRDVCIIIYYNGNRLFSESPTEVERNMLCALKKAMMLYSDAGFFIGMDYDRIEIPNRTTFEDFAKNGLSITRW